MVWREELPPQNTLAGGVKDGLQGTMELAAYHADDSRLEKKHQAVNSGRGRADLPGLLDS